MKRNKNKLISFILLVILLVGISGSVFAADSAIIFKGRDKGFQTQPGSNYTSTDLFGELKDVMPGDTLKDRIMIRHEASDCNKIKLYMKMIEHKDKENPLTYDEAYEQEDGKDETGVKGVRDETEETVCEFLSQLGMRIYHESALIYESTPDKTDTLTDYVYLGTLSRKETMDLTVELTVPEELGNEYAARVGEVDWIFLAETAETAEDTVLPQTGQLYWPVLVLVCLGAVFILYGIGMRTYDE